MFYSVPIFSEMESSRRAADYIKKKKTTLRPGTTTKTPAGMTTTTTTTVYLFKHIIASFGSLASACCRCMHGFLLSDFF